MCLIFSVVHNANSRFEMNSSEFLFKDILLADRSCYVVNLTLTTNPDRLLVKLVVMTRWKIPKSDDFDLVGNSRGSNSNE